MFTAKARTHIFIFKYVCVCIHTDHTRTYARRCVPVFAYAVDHASSLKVPRRIGGQKTMSKYTLVMDLMFERMPRKYPPCVFLCTCTCMRWYTGCVCCGLGACVFA